MAGQPNPPYLTYLPGNWVTGVWFTPQGEEFGYQYTTIATASLPTPAVAGPGGRAWVSDATSRTFGAAPTGGGSDIVPVWTDGVTWYIG